MANRQGIQLVETGYASIAKDAVLSSPSTNKQLVIHSASACNAYSASMDVGLGVRLASAAWKFWLVGASNTDSTSAIQAGTATSILPATNNYGFIVQAKDKFGLLSFTVSQAETGSPVYSYQYWNGSAWTTLTLRNSPVYTSTGSIGIAFAPPVDWTAGNGSATADFSSLTAGYCIRVRGTTAPGTAVQVTATAVSKFWAYRNLSSKSALMIDFEELPPVLDIGESVQAFFATAYASNSVEIAYQVNG